MRVKSKLLFETNTPFELGLGYHNSGSGTLRYAHQDVVNYVDKHYGQQCGQVPLNAKTVGLLVKEKTESAISQVAYLSSLFGRDIHLMSYEEVKNLGQDQKTLIVPYVSVPEAETEIKTLGAQMWGMPGKMTHVLKSKAEFHRLTEEISLDGFQTPDYVISEIDELLQVSIDFLKKIILLYEKWGVSNQYPLGLLLRSSDEDGNLGVVFLLQKQRKVLLIPNGNVQIQMLYDNWNEAISASQKILTKKINEKKESRIVISRYIENIDSPGMSLVMLDGSVCSLGWNGQLQDKGSMACIGTHKYSPKTSYLGLFQQKYEEKAAELFGLFLQRTADTCGLRFDTIRGIANVDMLIPSKLELQLQKKRGQKNELYFVECNARWTNYTDAIGTVIGVQRKPQTVSEMLRVIDNGIWTYDKYLLPKDADPKVIRELIFEMDLKLQKIGTRIICRMATNPMGLIFVGNLQRAENAMKEILLSYKSKKQIL